MRFQSVQILNYKGFRDSGTIDLAYGFNVIVGKNDAGKSALVEALSLQAPNKPHISLFTVPERSIFTETQSRIKATISITSKDVIEALSRYPTFSFLGDAGEDSDSVMMKFKSVLFDSKSFISEWIGGSLATGWLETDKKPSEQGNLYVASNEDYPHGLSLHLLDIQQSSPFSYAQILGSAFASRVYTFRAERLNVGECSVGSNHTLKPDASNLAEVLNLLISSNPQRFRKLRDYVKTIFPHITEITAPVVAQNYVKVKLWNVPPETEREDLAVPLSESGTGVGQVLSILYVVVTADTPKVIIIDEPQSFLHPGAARKLLEILSEYPQHQYIITTHSPTAITSIDIGCLLQVRRVGYESIVALVNMQVRKNLKLLLTDVGANLSDVFGADSVLWVEGKTEEECFPIIIRKLIKKPLLGIKILAVQSTADLEGKLASRVFDIYKQLTSAETILPPAIAFILDREGKSESNRATINAKSSGLVHWLPRRMYENYLLHPASIACVLNEEDSLECNIAEITSVQVEAWLSQHATDLKYFDTSDQVTTYPSIEWEERVHAAKLLVDMFGDLTNQRVSYDKVPHGRQLTELIINEQTPAILELGDFLQKILANTSSSTP